MKRKLNNEEVKHIVETKVEAKSFVESGDSYKCCQHLSAGYVLMSLAIAHLDTAKDILKKNNLLYGKLKTKLNNHSLSFDALEKEIGAYIKDEQREQLLKDYDNIDELVNNWLNLNK